MMTVSMNFIARYSCSLCGNEIGGLLSNTCIAVQIQDQTQKTGINNWILINPLEIQTKTKKPVPIICKTCFEKTKNKNKFSELEFDKIETYCKICKEKIVLYFPKYIQIILLKASGIAKESIKKESIKLKTREVLTNFERVSWCPLCLSNNDSLNKDAKEIPIASS